MNNPATRCTSTAAIMAMANDMGLLAFVFLSVVVSCIAACKCVDPPSVCTGNFAIRGRITNLSGNQTEHDDITYTVDVLEVLRHPSSRNAQQPIANLSSVRIMTGSHSCGYPGLETGGIYFIAGDFNAPSSYELAKCGGMVSRYNEHRELPYNTADTSTCSACTAVVSSIIFVFCFSISLTFK